MLTVAKAVGRATTLAGNEATVQPSGRDRSGEAVDIAKVPAGPRADYDVINMQRSDNHLGDRAGLTGGNRVQQSVRTDGVRHLS
ncbi:hypothetical protein [Phyllobacterium sp. CL33Tsu]|uniref:hypothetical protein n=1 Tax=Phyllobacterium sp. CL33Tsu TaxID=1798191 RepID=UPI0011145E8B|nr:hypothetical protein [Phyllobacterium sp. CL33Tsu]